MNSPVLVSNPTCTVCSKSIGEDISGLSFPGERERGGARQREGEHGERGEGMKERNGQEVSVYKTPDFAVMLGPSAWTMVGQLVRLVGTCSTV